MAQGEEALPHKTTYTNPLLSIFTKFFPKPQHQQVKNEAQNSKIDENITRVDEKHSNDKADVVKFPLNQPQLPPLKLESDEVENDTNPIVLWQVYALGGFIVLRWVWAKWQEKKAKAKKDSSGEEDPPTDD